MRVEVEFQSEESVNPVARNLHVVVLLLRHLPGRSGAGWTGAAGKDGGGPRRRAPAAGPPAAPAAPRPAGAERPCPARAASSRESETRDALRPMGPATSEAARASSSAVLYHATSCLRAVERKGARIEGNCAWSAVARALCSAAKSSCSCRTARQATRLSSNSGRHGDRARGKRSNLIMRGVRPRPFVDAEVRTVRSSNGLETCQATSGPRSGPHEAPSHEGLGSKGRRAGGTARENKCSVSHTTRRRPPPFTMS